MSWAAMLPGATGAAVAVLALGLRGAALRPVRRTWAGMVAREGARAQGAGLGVGGAALLAIEFGAAAMGAGAAWFLTGLPALAVAGAVAGAGTALHLLAERQAALRRRRQDAVLEAVRTLRRLLDTGAVGVPAALGVLADSGPRLLRPQLRRVVAATSEPGRRRAWKAARAEVGEGSFDLLAAAVELQRPAGGELGALFAELEAAVAGVHEVEREAAALSVQARSAAVLIIALPVGFICLMCSIGSSYLDPYRSLGGELFLGGALAVMGAAYVWIRAWLRLPGQPRLELRDV